MVITASGALVVIQRTAFLYYSSWSDQVQWPCRAAALCLLLGIVAILVHEWFHQKSHIVVWKCYVLLKTPGLFWCSAASLYTQHIELAGSHYKNGMENLISFQNKKNTSWLRPVHQHHVNPCRSWVNNSEGLKRDFKHIQREVHFGSQKAHFISHHSSFLNL